MPLDTWYASNKYLYLIQMTLLLAHMGILYPLPNPYSHLLSSGQEFCHQHPEGQHLRESWGRGLKSGWQWGG